MQGSDRARQVGSLLEDQIVQCRQKLVYGMDLQSFKNQSELRGARGSLLAMRVSREDMGKGLLQAAGMGVGDFAT